MHFLLQESHRLFGIRSELIVAVILGGFAILACISAYAAQRWAHQCHVELKKLNASLEKMQKEQGGITPPERVGSYLDEQHHD
ncbi:MAG: hypothetical protein IPK87_07875 [Planctomycetes bacterium]|nr:hypothetical protein [Planctomycetota bacterium]